MSRTFLLSSIFIVASVLAWLGYEEMQRSRTLIAQTNEIVRVPDTTSTPVDQTVQTESPATTDSPDTTPPDTAPQVLSNESLVVSNESPTTTSAKTSQETPASTQPEASTPSDAAPVVCSSLGEAGLLAAFDSALAVFLSGATATYGNRYENLQYELSSKQGVINGEQGIVTTSYSGTVKELSTDQDVSANGTITATFNWDGCTWQLVDYSF
jgi:hypothetical protein